MREERQIDSLTNEAKSVTAKQAALLRYAITHPLSQCIYLCNQKLDHVSHTFFNQFVDVGVELFLQKKGRKFKET